MSAVARQPPLVVTVDRGPGALVGRSTVRRLATMSFWPTQEHWSVKIPLHTPHPRLEVLAATGFVQLADHTGEVPAEEWERLEYMDWKSGGDTNFAPIASADGEL